MDISETIKRTYWLLAKGEMPATLEAYNVARKAIPDAEGPALLTLQEIITETLDFFLSDLREYGINHRVQDDVDFTRIDIQVLADECALAWEEVKWLCAAGITSEALTNQYQVTWPIPIGSRDWMDRMTLSVPCNHDPEWIELIRKKIDFQINTNDPVHVT